MEAVSGFDHCVENGVKHGRPHTSNASKKEAADCILPTAIRLSLKSMTLLIFEFPFGQYTTLP